MKRCVPLRVQIWIGSYQHLNRMNLDASLCSSIGYRYFWPPGTTKPEVCSPCFLTLFFASQTRTSVEAARRCSANTKIPSVALTLVPPKYWRSQASRSELVEHNEGFCRTETEWQRGKRICGAISPNSVIVESAFVLGVGRNSFHFYFHGPFHLF